MSLQTGKRIHRYQWDIIPITQVIGDRVDELARNEGQSIVAENSSTNDTLETNW